MGVVGSAKRPGALEAFIVLNGLTTFLSAVRVIGYFADGSVPRWFPPFFSVYNLVLLLCLIGLWQMSRRALFVLIAAVAVNQAAHALAGRWDPAIAVLPVLLIGTALFHVKKLR
jgi:hypothetical protein